MAAKEKILVIDDDPDFLEFVTIVLESKDYEVYTAEGVRGGLALMRQVRPDLVLLDVMMSYALDGLDVIREMHGDSELKKIPLIMISAIVSREEAALFPTDEYLKADLFMSKPIEPAKLLEQVAKLIAHQKE